MEFKTCFKCKDSKEIINFNKCKSNKDGLQRKCKSCEKKNHNERYKDLDKRTDKITRACIYNKLKRDNESVDDRRIRLAKAKKWYEDNKEQQKIYRKCWYKENHDYYIKRSKVPINKLIQRCRTQTRNAFKKKSGNGYLKKHTKELLGVSCWGEAKTHMENLFTGGMCWENMHLWHIDHIKPIHSFDLTDPIQFETCFNIKNLQPLWIADNLSKGCKYPYHY